jgi:MFS family permease
MACGLGALAVLWRIPTLPVDVGAGSAFFSRLAIPLRDVNFRRFLQFHLGWSFGVYFASPFFAVYMLKDLRLSYTIVTLLTCLTALCNMIGMRFWGRMIDRYSAKPVNLLGSIAATMFPALWLVVPLAPLGAVLPLVHILGGFGWSAVDLSGSALLLALAPQRERALYLSVYAACTGLMAALAQIAAGVAGKLLSDSALQFFAYQINPYLSIFALSCLLRMASLPLYFRIREPREVPVERLLPVFGNLRTLNTMMGFESLFQYTYMQGAYLDKFLTTGSTSLRQRLARLDHTTDAYAKKAEDEVEGLVESGETAFKATQKYGAALEHDLDTYVSRSERRIAA